MNQQPASSWALGFAALPLLYVLSVGPIARMVDKTGWNVEPVRRIYTPVIWLHDHTLLEKPLEWYLEAWGVH